MADLQNIKTRLVASFMQFLSDELKAKTLSEDKCEGIEVAIQCLGNAFELNLVDGSLPSKKPILEVFENYMKSAKEEASASKEISNEDKAQADKFKVEGNELMKNEQFEAALEAYSKAIAIDDTNPIYYCNRGAAHSRLGNHMEAIDDCKIAVKHDPNYSKAYCRMGLAYVNLNDHQRARDCYKKAYELDPSESNKNNLDLAQEKMREQEDAFKSGMDFGSILNNPGLMEMAGKMMADPNMQNMMANLLGGSLPGGFPGMPGPQSQSATEGGSSEEGGSGQGLEAFMRMGQQFAEQMKNTNPDLIAKLKDQFQSKSNEDDNPEQ